MTLTDLDELADDELHARLTQRGVDPGRAARLVSRRDAQGGPELLLDLLNGTVEP